jgi:hypothetical protein
MSLMSHLGRIASADQSVRRAELLSMLREIGAPFIHFRERVGNYWPENIVVSFCSDDVPRYVIGAHYDSVRGSTGANDNAAAVCILLSMVETFLSVPPAIPLDVVFFDLEEIGVAGGNLTYIERVGIPKILGMINLDICGVGDTILAAPGMCLKNGPLFDALESTVGSEKYPARMVGRLPPGDDRIFEGRDIPTITTCIVPADDVESLLQITLAIDSIGKPPEKMPSIFETFHCASRDSIDVIEEQAMITILDWTRDLVAQLH